MTLEDARGRGLRLERYFTWEVKMGLKRRVVRGEGLLPFISEEVEGNRAITSYAGLPLLAEAYRACGASEAVRRCVVTRERYRQRGLSDDQLVESFCLLLGMGADCVEDFEQAAKEIGLAQLIGHEFPSPTRAKQFLYDFHDAAQQASATKERALIPGLVRPENAPLEGLHEAVRATVFASQAANPATRATVDVDASIIESRKQEACWTYEGTKGYQPVVAVWAERDLILLDEFRDGNVPAGNGLLEVAQAAVATLPKGLEEIYFRSDSAGYTHDLLNWLRAEVEGRAPIIFGISADMSVELRAAIEKLAEAAWKPLARRNAEPDLSAEASAKADERRHWAEVEFIPDAPSHVKGRRPDRYLAIRIQPRQGKLFADGSPVKYFAIVTNDWTRPGDELIHWQRQRCGTIEHTHEVLKNELGAGTLPCGRFGANAAWFRLNALTYNLLSLMRQTALPKELATAKPKRLRFKLLCVAGEVVHHARMLFVRLWGTLTEEGGILERARLALRRLALLLAAARAAPEPAS
jgi:hypothetical protein